MIHLAAARSPNSPCSVKSDCGWLNAAGPERLIAKYGGPVPRYTSYPTAVNFGAHVGAAQYADWLGGIGGETTLSLYVHVPFCRELCWYCGCHTTVARSRSPIDDYVDTLLAEIALVGNAVGGRPPVSALHFGGGSPNSLSVAHLERILAGLRQRFAFRAGTAIAAELDPRALTVDWIRAAARLGLTRASLGVQTFDAEVQAAINRRQSYDLVRQATERLREEGVASVNFDLMYGLPSQTTRSVLDTIDQAIDLKPDRVALFGYAHVPWMMARQRLIGDSDLPGPLDRISQQLAARASLVSAGYAEIGLDHFARPGDDLYETARARRARRNFQGYTIDDADCLIGLGASAIGSFPRGFVQNAAAIPQWRAAIRAGVPATARGLTLTREDRFRGEIIERLMCDLEIDLAAICRRWNRPTDEFAAEWDRLIDMAADGLLTIEGTRILVTDPGRSFLRQICATFDRYLPPAGGTGRHALAV